MSRRIAIVAAMESEVAPLVRGWKVREVEHAGRKHRLFENGNAVVICGGIGPEAARRAAEVVINKAQPACVISVGFAGALDSSLKIADVLTPKVVVNAADGARTEATSGQGTLVSYAAVADPEQKKQLAQAYAAIAVDMEAAGVAQSAQINGLEFAALKAISDTAEFDLPPMDRFVGSDGRFCLFRFVRYVAAHPKYWKATIALGRNSAKASKALSAAIERYLA